LSFSHINPKILHTITFIRQSSTNMTSTSQTIQSNDIQLSMETDWPFDMDFSAYINVDNFFADFIPEVVDQGCVGHCPSDFTQGVPELSFRELSLADLATETVEMNFEDLFPDFQLADEGMQNPLAENTQLTGEASLGPADDGVSVPSFSGSTVAQPSESGVPALPEVATAIGEAGVRESKLLTEEEQEV
jgi:hypothetical protein